MDKARALRIVAAPSVSVSDKIRALDAAGYPRAEIARMLDKRYQHVRNVLEADKLRAAPRSEAQGGVAEPASRFESALAREVEDRGGGQYRLVVREDGSVILPPAVRAAFGIRGRGAVMARFEGDTFKLVTAATALREIDELLQPYRTEGASWADELIAERRQEADREGHDA